MTTLEVLSRIVEALRHYRDGLIASHECLNRITFDLQAYFKARGDWQ